MNEEGVTLMRRIIDWKMSYAVILVLATLHGCSKTGDVETQSNSDPLNASYRIGDQVVTLVNGRAATPAAPGPAWMA